MLGIDIVDLTDPLLKKRSSRAIDLIKSPGDKLIDQTNIFWLLWTAKEAVFKSHREPLVFDPKSIRIELNLKEDVVFFKSDQLEGKMIQSKEYILAVCSDDLSSISFEVFEETSKNWHDRLRELIKDFFFKKEKDIEIGSDDLNLPILLPTKETISITHHGRFGAFVYPTSFLDS